MVHYTLNRAPYTIRLLSSLFLFFALSGQIIVVLYGLSRFGMNPEGAKVRYAGDEENMAFAEENTDADGNIDENEFEDDNDEIDLSAIPSTIPVEQKSLFFAISWDELLRLTHVHTFAGGMLFYILGHLFSLTTIKPRLKRTMLVLFFFSIAFFIAGPFLIRYLSPMFVYLFLVSIFLFLFCGVFFSITALWDMWGGRSKKPARS